jgi:hypothetical protein
MLVPFTAVFSPNVFTKPLIFKHSLSFSCLLSESGIFSKFLGSLEAILSSSSRKSWLLFIFFDLH